MVTVTIFKNIYDNVPFYSDLSTVLDRIRTGVSKTKVEEIRSALDKDKAKSLKKNLPCIRFSGKFATWKDESLLEHSGYLVLDFDKCDVEVKMAEITEQEYVYAAWVSPSGNGIKVLVKIADGKKHREHFEALKELYPDVDKSGINESRICFESYDPFIYINEEAKPFTKIKITEQIESKVVLEDNKLVFQNLLKWITNRGDAFVTGERNIYLFKLAAACCRFGLDEDTATNLMVAEYKSSQSDCSLKGFLQPIRNAYKANRHKQGTARFEKEVLVDKVSRKEINVSQEFEQADNKLKDVVYGIDMKENAIDIYRNGYANIKGVDVPELDQYWKPWRKEITLLTGHGNYGKSSFMKWYWIIRAVLFGEKMAMFAPEDKREMFYHELTEILLGMDATPANPYRVSEQEYSAAYDFISAHFFYVYPETLAPTPEYIKEKFLELIIKEGVDWCVVDPFNQMTNDYKMAGGRDDKYLEVILGDFKRFAMMNDVFFVIVAHPKQMAMGSDGNYPCPNFYDLAGGAIWNAKMDNILVYHRPLAQTAPTDPTCELHTKKIKDQKVVGKKGFILFNLDRKSRRFYFSGRDHLQVSINNMGLSWKNVIPMQTRLIAA